MIIDAKKFIGIFLLRHYACFVFFRYSSTTTPSTRTAADSSQDEEVLTISESDIQDDETISEHQAISVEEQLLQESNELSMATHSDSEPKLSTCNRTMDSTILSEQTSMTAATLHLEDELEQMDSDTGTAIAETTENTDENNNTLPVASSTHRSTILENSAAFSDNIDIGQVVTGSYSTTDPKSKYLCLKHNYVPKNKQDVASVQATSGSQKGSQLSFQISWLEQYSWLVYSPSLKGGLCKICVLFATRPQHSTKEKLGVFVNDAFRKYKKAKGKDGYLNIHENATYHKDAIVAATMFLQSFRNPNVRIESQLSELNRTNYEDNIHVVKRLIEAILLLERQGLPLRGKQDDKIDFENEAAHNEGNLIALLRYTAKSDKILANHLIHCKRNAKYTSKTIQNEIISSIRLVLHENLLAPLKAAKPSFYSVIADEATDTVTNQEVLSLCIRYCDQSDETLNSPVREVFIDLVNLERTTGEKIAENIVKLLEEAGLDPQNIRGQAYDGAKNMSSDGKGVQGIIKRTQTDKAIYVHCKCHVLNLAICSACKDSEVRDLISNINETFLFLHFFCPYILSR